MDNKKYKPLLRFNGFHEDWVVKKLGEVADIKTGPFGSFLHASDYVEEGMPIITTEHFKIGYLPREKSGIPQVNNSDYVRLKNYILNIGDIVFSRVGSVDINALVTKKQNGWLFSGRVLRVRLNKFDYSQFLHILLETYKIRNDIKNRAVGQTMPSINTEILKITFISLPTLPEQELIGNYFKHLDELINSKEKKIAKLKSIKAACLDKMFPKEGEAVPQLRFKGFNEDWVVKKLGEVAPLRGGYAFQSTKYKNEGIPIIRISNILPNGNIGGEYVYYENQKNDDSFLLKKNDVLIAMSGATTGKVSIINEYKNSKYYQNQRVGLLTKKDGYDYFFIATIVQTNLFIKQMKNVLVAGAQPNVSSRDIDSFVFSLPTLPEQELIGNYFKHLDELIEKSERQLEKLKSIKQGCLDKMFIND